MSETPMPTTDLLERLLEWLRIPSVSTGKQDREALRSAAEWARDYVTASSPGQATLLETDGNPIVEARFDANTPGAPTVLAYGHYDVQGPEPLDLWETDPFDPVIKDGRIFARGASDDKGNFWPLLYAACEMSRAGELPVNVRVLIEGEEERGSEQIMRMLAADDEHADAGIIFDSGRIGPRPTLTLGSRGAIAGYVHVKVADGDLHSGVYGGAVPNALHVLIGMLQTCIAGPDGKVPDELRAGIDPIPDAERAMWNDMPPGHRAITRAGAHPLFPDAGERYYEMTGWETTFEVDEIKAGDPRTVIPARASAYISLRLAPGQRWKEILDATKEILTSAAPPYAEVSFDMNMGVDAAGFDPECAVMRAARRAYVKAFGQEPALWRLGGTLPLMDVLAKRGIETVLTGFAGADDQIHAPNESYRVTALEEGRLGARALFTELATLDPSS